MVDSGDCRRRPITGNNSDKRKNCRHGGWAHIFANENKAIFRGDSFTFSLLPGFKAITEQSATSLINACQEINQNKSLVYTALPYMDVTKYKWFYKTVILMDVWCTCIAPLDTMSSQSRLEFRTRLLNAPAAFALVLSSSAESRIFANCGIDLRSCSYKWSLW